MKQPPEWQYDEMRQCGVDYSDPAHVSAYDARHCTFRDFQKEADLIMALLDLDHHHTVIDMGCGTGAFTLTAAKQCAKLYAVDVSLPMLNTCRRKADQIGLTNIECCHGGFLTYEHQAEPVDAIVSVAVLHHLPDFWKLIGLQRSAAMLKPGGKFYLFDVVWSFDPAQYQHRLNRWTQMFKGDTDSEFQREPIIHARQEYSTCDWIMEGILERAGFCINQARYQDNYLAMYLCTKK
jgi:cyclopropane fatty-acyl-phospholipid synthase-like methyltransferase